MDKSQQFNLLEPTEDERDGMAWWNLLSESQRTYWLTEASDSKRMWNVSPADAWVAYKMVYHVVCTASRGSCLKFEASPRFRR